MSRTQCLLFFLGVSLVYGSFSPGFIGGMGYMSEEIRATAQLQDALTSPNMRESLSSVQWSRNGIGSLALHAPFVLVARHYYPIESFQAERILALEPVLFTAGILTILALWISRSTGSVRRGLVFAVTAGFTTMLWPYAYIGLETAQSFFLLLAGFLALGTRTTPSWPRTLALTFAATFAVCSKSTGAFLVPAVLYLLWCYFERGRTLPKRTLALQASISVILLFGGLWLNSWTRAFFWDDLGGSAPFIRSWLAHSPLQIVINGLGFLASPNKGLVLFAPVVALSLLALPRCFRVDRNACIFALLVLAGLGGGFSLLTNWADETWGPRYLHAAIAPVLLAYAASLQKNAMPRVEMFAATAAAALGLYVSFLGSFFYYGLLHRAATATGQSTLEALQFDPVWNHIRFNERLLKVWLADRPDLHWTPSHQWFFEKPPGAADWKSANLSEMAHPQPLLIRAFEESGPVATKVRRLYLVQALGGLALLIGVGVRTWKRTGRDALPAGRSVT